MSSHGDELPIVLPKWSKDFVQPYVLDGKGFPTQVPGSVPVRYRTLYGGRGGTKSWFFARLSLALAATGEKRILCAREFQTSIRDSVHQLLRSQISMLGIDDLFHVTEKYIRSRETGSEYLFKGLHHNTQEIKSMEDVDICWVEEARNTSKESLDVLIPTIRKPGSEIWFSFNTGEATDPVYSMMVVNPPPGSLVRKTLWSENEWLSPELDQARRYMLEHDPESYANIWDGEPVSFSEAQVFRNKWAVDVFEPGTDWDGPYYGADWGFSTDPTALTRSWIHDDTLFVEHEKFGWGVENDDLAELFDQMPDSRKYEIWADSSRPETVSHVSRRGFRVRSAPKWPGSVEDGVSRLRMFKRIVLHARCKHMGDEARNYKHRVDRLTGSILPDIVDKNNHGWDSIRYALHKIIRNKSKRTYAGA